MERFNSQTFPFPDQFWFFSSSMQEKIRDNQTIAILHLLCRKIVAQIKRIHKKSLVTCDGKYMRPYPNKKMLFFICLFAGVSFFTSANAYVLQGPHILKIMVDKLGSARRLLVHQKLILFHNESEDAPVELNETLRYIFPEKFRSDILTENVQRIHVISEGAVLIVIDGKPAAESETLFDHYKDILLYRYRKFLESRLLGLGIDIHVSSLGRFLGRPAYVIGAQYPDETAPQLWIDMETFRPVRWIIKSGAAKNLTDFLEVRYLEWHEKDRAVYPMRIDFYQNDTLIREIRVETVQVDPSFPDDLFDIRQIESTYRSKTPVVPSQQESEGMGEVQKTIEEFKKIYE